MRRVLLTAVLFPFSFAVQTFVTETMSFWGTPSTRVAKARRRRHWTGRNAGQGNRGL